MKIRYVGPQDLLPFTDTLFGTGLTWLNARKAHKVSAETGLRMLSRPDLWADAEAAPREALSVRVHEPEPPPLPNLDRMSAQQMSEYAQRYFNEPLDLRTPVSDMRHRIQCLINRPQAWA